MTKITKGMVLAAGRGERMRPLTDVMPKPMIEVAGRSMVDRAIDRLEEAGVSHIVVNTSYKADMLEAHLQKRTTTPISFSREQTALETGGGVKQALHYFGNEPFYAVNGDIIWLDGKTPALKRLTESWDDGLDALLLLQDVHTAIGYSGKGDFTLEDNGMLTRRGDLPAAPYVYAGVQILHPRLFKNATETVFSLNILYDEALAANPPRIKALAHDGQWLHVGDVAGKKAAEAVLKG